MAKFQVDFAFKCKNCGEPNDQTIEMQAPDKDLAGQFAHRSAACSKCHEPIGAVAPFTVAVKPLD
jgi:hypothetical protein